VFHLDSRGLDRATAVGLVCFLNCTLVDVYVRQFSGHTQINAGDLRHLRYPSAAELRSIGVAVGEDPIPADQAEVDQLVACHIPAFDDPTLHAALREVA
jgi:adenine-specific DNA-methyltransferase